MATVQQTAMLLHPALHGIVVWVGLLRLAEGLVMVTFLGGWLQGMQHFVENSEGYDRFRDSDIIEHRMDGDGVAVAVIGSDPSHPNRCAGRVPTPGYSSSERSIELFLVDPLGDRAEIMHISLL